MQEDGPLMTHVFVEMGVQKLWDICLKGGMVYCIESSYT